MPTTSPKVLPAGTLLGRFRIESLAGTGGMGEVYQAFDATLERSVALKRLRLDAEDPRAIARFRREATSLAQLNHPAVCQVYDLAETDAGYFIAMEWVEGRTLAQMLGDPRAPLPPEQARRILQAVAEALSAAHAKGIVHRDLKPGNVMVTPEGGVKVLDFGLAKGSADAELPPPSGPNPVAALGGEEPTLDRPFRPSGANEALTEAGLFMGTLGYASPEQIRGRWVTAASDLFSFGILAHELLTGLKPFEGDGDQLLRAVVKNRRVPLARRPGPRRLWSLIERLLQSDPKVRPTAAQAAEELAEMARPVSPAWWAGLSAAGALLLAFGGYWLFGRGVLAGLVKGRPARVAVLGFRNETGNPLFDAQTELGLADLLSDALRDSPKLQVMDSGAIAQAAQILKLNPAKASPEDQQRLAKALGADLILTGSLDRKDGKDHLHFLMRDRGNRVRAEGNTEQPSFSAQALQGQGLVAPTAARLLKAIDPLGGAETSEHLATLDPDTFAAYAKGLDAFRHGRFAEAEPLLVRAAYSNPEWTDGVYAYAANLVSQRKGTAEPVLRWALVAARSGRNKFDESNVLQYLGKWALASQDFEAAESYFHQAFLLADARADKQGLSFILNGLGRVAQARQDSSKAQALFQQALEAARSAGDSIMQTQIRANLGNLELSRGNLSAAEAHYREGAEMASSIGDESGEALALNNLGIVLLSAFKLDQASSVLEQSLALRQKNGEARWIVSGHRNIGIGFEMKGNLLAARECFQRSLNMALTIQDTYGEAQARFYLAELDRRAGRILDSLKGYQSASALLESSRDATRLGQSLAGEAEAHIRLHRIAPAVASLARAKPLIPGNPYLLRAQAWSEYIQGHPNEALILIDQAIQDPNHDGPEIRDELMSLKHDFQSH